MDRRAILLAGSEPEHLREIVKFARYLASIGCHVITAAVKDNPFGTLLMLADKCKSIPQETPLLIAYCGHGNGFGWQAYQYGFVLPYECISWAVRRRRGPLLFINDTCYGASYLKKLARFRSDTDTCFLAPWDGDGESRAGVIRDAIYHWSDGHKLEDEVGGQIHSDEHGDREVPVQIHWGTRLEHLFFPSSV